MRVFSADDFGIGQKVNQRILQLAEAGKLDRIAVMTHGSISHEEVQRLLESGVCLDAHLDIDGKIHARRKAKEGTLKQVSRFGFRFLFGRHPLRSVERVWEAQIVSFKDLFGKYPDGLNAHRHLHFFPLFFRIMIRLGKKYHIPYIRLGQRGFVCMKSAALVLDVLRILNRKALFQESGIKTSDLLVSADWILPCDPEGVARTRKEETTEIVFHPERDEEWEYLGNCLHSRYLK